MEFCVCGHQRALHDAFPVSSPDTGCQRCGCTQYRGAPNVSYENKFGVVSGTERVLFMIARGNVEMAGIITREDALNLAAWLVFVSGGRERFLPVYSRVVEQGVEV